MSTPTASEAARIKELLDQGLALQAKAAAEAVGPIADWSGTEAQLLASRLRAHLGDQRGSLSLALRVWRRDRSEPAGVRAAAFALQRLRPGLPAREFAESRRELLLRSENEDELSHGHCILALAATQLRDFGPAETEVARALEIAPGSPWVRVTAASLRAAQDRHEDALQAGREALELRPSYGPGLQTVADAAVSLGRDDEAIALLQEGLGDIESHGPAMQLIGLLYERGERERAVALLPELDRLAPWADSSMRLFRDRLLCDEAAWRGDRERELELARGIDSPFHRRLVERLSAAPPDAVREVLDVPFVQQHHMTCAPATLASICSYWKMPGDHLEVAAEICYDGTPAHKERTWAEESGWRVREFTVNERAASELLKRGVPFTLTTVEPGWAHLQAVIGRDEARGSLLVRDPSSLGLREALADKLLEAAASTGPRGMALVPEAEGARLDGLELPDAAIWDEYHQLQKALDAGQREQAGRLADDLDARAPGHRLAILGRFSLAHHDGDEPERLAQLNRLHELYPDDPRIAVWRLRSLQVLERHEQRLAGLEELASRRHAHPALLVALANELGVDGRRLDEAARHAKAALRRMPLDAGALDAFARVSWRLGDHDAALRASRAACTLNPTDEGLAATAFATYRALGRTDEGLQLLRDRVDNFGEGSHLPARTLVECLEELGRSAEAQDVLAVERERRVDDPEFLITCSWMRRLAGRLDDAAALLDRVESTMRRPDWLRERATLARIRGELSDALALWAEILEIEPTATDAHAAYARLLGETQGPLAARRHLESAVERFPHHLMLHRLRVDELRGVDPDECRAALETLLEDHPHDAWAWRELALVEADLGRDEHSQQALRRAEEYDPDGTSTHAVAGGLHWRAGRFDEARRSWQAAVRADVDNGYAISRLLGAARGPADRRDVIALVRERLAERPSTGEAIECLLEGLEGCLDADERLALTRELHAERPDLWQCWSGLAQALGEARRSEDALELAREAVDRFPLVGPLRLILAERYRSLERFDECRAVLEEEKRIHPDNSAAPRRLSELAYRQGRFEDALELVEEASAREPLDPTLHGRASDLLWALGRKEDAVRRAQHAVTVHAGYAFAWGKLAEWSRELEDPELVRGPARELTRSRPGAVTSWTALAHALDGPDELEERLAALERAIELSPVDPELHDERAWTLFQLHRFDEASAACRPPVFGDDPPLPLRGRAAWIEAQLGRLDQARTLMRQAVEADPSYAWGWARLAEWASAAGEPQAELEAVEQLVELAPDDADSLAWRGDLRLARRETRADGKRDLARAVALDASNLYAGTRLFEARMNDDEHEEAEGLLASIEPHLSPPQLLYRRLWLAVETKRDEDTRSLVEAMAQVEAPDSTSHELALRELAKSERPAEHWEAFLRAAASAPGGNAAAAEALVARSMSGPHAKRLRTILESFEPGSAAWAAAIARLFEGAEESTATRLALRLAKKHESVLMANDRLWGATGCLLLRAGKRPRALRWMKDWQSRGGLQPWMLLNLASALMSSGRHREALEAAWRGLQLPPDHATSELGVVAASLSLAWNDIEAAGQAGSVVSPPELSEYYQGLWDLFHAVFATEPTSAAGARAAQREGWKRLDSLYQQKTWLAKEPGLKQVWRRLAWRVVRRQLWTGLPGAVLRVHFW